MHADAFSLFLVRHAEAASVGDGVRSDADRPLTARGAEDASVMGRLLARMGDPPAMILTSSLRRARETGDIIGRSFDPAVASSVCSSLQPGFSNADFLEELLALRRIGQESVLAVGHQPDIGVLINYLIAGSAPASLAIAPGTMTSLTLRVTGGRAEGVLRWMLSPAAARAMLLPQTTTATQP